MLCVGRENRVTIEDRVRKQRAMVERRRKRSREGFREFESGEILFGKAPMAMEECERKCKAEKGSCTKILRRV